MRILLNLILILSLVAPVQAYSVQSEVTRLINQGITYHSNRNFLLAIKSFTRALELDPENEHVKKNLIISHNN